METKISLAKRFPPGESLKMCLRYSVSPRERLVPVSKLVCVCMYIRICVCVWGGGGGGHPKQFNLMNGNLETMRNTLLLKTLKQCNLCYSYRKLFKQTHVYINCIFSIKIFKNKQKTTV